MNRLRLSRVIPFFATVVLIILALWLLSENKPEPEVKAIKPRSVKVFTLRSKATEQDIVAYSQGTVRPRHEIMLRSQVEGRATFVSDDFVTGGRFQKGDLLIQLDTSDYELAVIQREANVARATQDLARAQAQADIANIELAHLGRENPSELARWLPQLRRAKADLSSAEALLAQARLNLSRTKIVAPFNGRVKAETVEAGQYLSRNSALGSIYATDVMEVPLALNEQQLALIDLPVDFYTKRYEEGIETQLTATIAGKSHNWQARIVRTEGVIDEGTRNVTAIAEVQASKASTQNLVPGVFVDAMIKGKTVQNATILPLAALRTGNKVWIINDGKLAIVDVSPLQRSKDTVIVTGLADKSQVITSSLAVATPGMLVKSIKPQKDKKPKQATPPAADEAKSSGDAKHG